MRLHGSLWLSKLPGVSVRLYLMKVPCSLHWSDNVVSPLHYGSWDVPDGIHIVYKIVITLKPASIDKVMTGE